MKSNHKSGEGWQIVEYDETSRTWQADTTQPVGSAWSGLSVDAKGLPSIVPHNSTRSFWRKKEEGWVEVEACSWQVGFGKGDDVFRLDCDDHVYGNDRERLDIKKAVWMSASTDAVWILDKNSDIPFKFN